MGRHNKEDSMSRLLRNAMLAAGLVSLGAACDSKSTTRADNTARNDRDRAGDKTADQAGQRKADVDLTAEIREAVVADDSLSMNAKNVKIIVDDHAVTLRGPVASADERATVERIAINVAGERRVINELELAP
jgi:osmotically-inducible protein OsmY